MNEEVLKVLKHLSKGTDGFNNPRLLLMGGYALGAFIPLTRFTRDCDFVTKREDGWTIERLCALLPQDFSVECLWTSWRGR